MKQKFIEIVIFMLLTTTMVSAINIKEIQNDQTIQSDDGNTLPYIPGLNWGVDQKQTWTDRYGMIFMSPTAFAQSFTPTKETLTAVARAIFKHGTPIKPTQITVSIRKNLTDSDLTTKTINTSSLNIDKYGKWVIFDFEDLSITPGTPYFIICSGNGDNATNAYCWFYSNNSTYDPGQAWIKYDNYSGWITLKEIGYGADFCFKTYFKKPLDSPIAINNENLLNLKVFSLFTRYPLAFPLLRNLLGY